MKLICEDKYLIERVLRDALKKNRFFPLKGFAQNWRSFKVTRDVFEGFGGGLLGKLGF